MNTEEHESRDMSGVTRRGRIVVVSVLSGVLLTGLLAWWAVSAGHSRYHRDPTQAGLSREYDRKMEPQLAVRPDMDGVLDSIEIITNEPDILIEMPVRRDLDDHIDNTLFDFHRIDPGEAFESPAGRIWLDHVAVAHGEFPADQANAYSVLRRSSSFRREWVSGWDIPAVS